MKKSVGIILLAIAVFVPLLEGCEQDKNPIVTDRAKPNLTDDVKSDIADHLKSNVADRIKSLEDCEAMVVKGLRPIATHRADRFLGKVEKQTARCRGGERALKQIDTPWVDWQNYWGTGDKTSKAGELTGLNLAFGANNRGIDGALMDLEYQRIELIKFNLFDNNGTYEQYIKGRDGVGGRALRQWPQMRLPSDHPNYRDVGGGGEQTCWGPLIRHRTVSGICNDIRNPLIGSTNQLYARNVEFEATFPRLRRTELVRNRHGDRLALLKPDPQVISRKLFTRAQSQPDKCNNGYGLPDASKDANCDYKKAPFFNVLAAFWIQFMNHDWFSHLQEGHNTNEMMELGCKTKKVAGVETPLTPTDANRLGCRPADRMEKAYIADNSEPAEFQHDGATLLVRAPKTTKNTVTAWWDASQIYGYDDRSRMRVKRDPQDRAKLLMVRIGERAGAGERYGYLPVLKPNDPINAAWAGQEATAFADNWTVGMSFFHNLFAREHNIIVDEFRKRAQTTPSEDSGLRDPARPDAVITYHDVTDDELFEVARLIVAAEIAKIHTIEWTTQLLYSEPLYKGMNANWGGLLHGKHKQLTRIMDTIVTQNFAKSKKEDAATSWYSVFASGAGIFGLGSKVYAKDRVFASFRPKEKDLWDLRNPDHVNGGINHFGSPFNFPEEFPTVYRLHPLLPDLLEYREWDNDPNVIRQKVSVARTFRGPATDAMRSKGLANWALSMGRQRLGLLALQNHPRFLQYLVMKRLNTETNTVDIAALDIIRDRERGIPRINEFRRQIGLKSLTGFDDYVDRHLPEQDPGRKEQERIVGILREVYGQHRCDATKFISTAQRNDDGSPINDCLGHPDGSMVDNIEDVDVVVGMLAESTRPHGFAISETQFQLFILNASRRLFSDRFFTSSFRPEFYTHLGIAWVNDNGPNGKVMEKGHPNGHEQEVAPLKRVVMRAMPELASELEHVVNTFDPWARDRGEYYSLQWVPRPDAKTDGSFSSPEQ